MAINFPANPVQGQEFSTETTTYVFNGSFWTVASSAVYHANDYVTYQYLKVDVQEEGSSVVEAPSVLNFIGPGVALTSDGRAVTINVSGGGGSAGSSSNEYATYINAISTAHANDWASYDNLSQNLYATWSNLSQNIYATWSNLSANDYATWSNLSKNIYATWSNLNANDYATWSNLSENIYATWSNVLSFTHANDRATYSNLSINSFATWSNARIVAHANDWATYNNTLAVAFSNDYATYDLLSIIVQQEGVNKYTAPKVLNFVGTAFTLNTIGDEVVISLPDLADAAEANAYLTYLATQANDWVTYNAILGSSSAQFTASKTFLQDVTIVGNLVVVGNSVTASQQSLAIAASNIILNDGGLDATAIGGGILVEGTNNVILTKLEYDPASVSKWYIDGQSVARFTDFQSNDLLTLRQAESNDWNTLDYILSNSNARFTVAKYFDEDLIARTIYPENDATYGLGTLGNQWKFLRLSEELLINSISVTANATNLLLPSSTLIGEIDTVANQWLTYDILVNNTEDAFNVSKVFRDGLTVNGNLSVGYSGIIANVKLIDGNVILNYNSTTENASNVQIIVKGTDDQTLTYLGYDPESSSKWIIDDVPVALAPEYQANDYATYTNLRIQVQYEGANVYLAPSNINFTGPGVFVSSEGANVNVYVTSADITQSETYANDLASYSNAVNDAYANDFALYQTVAVQYRERGTDVALTPTIIDFVGANLELSGSILTVQVSEAFLKQTAANDYATWNNLTINSYATLANAYANDYITQSVLFANDYATKNLAQANDYLTRSDVTGNLYTTYITLTVNDYSTYNTLTGNIYQTYSTLAANDYTTYSGITGNLYQTHSTLAANDYNTLKVAESNDWLTYRNITSNRDADFLTDKSFRGNVHIHANLFVYGNIYATVTEELFIANSRFIINDNGTDESAEYGGILVEGTNNTLVGAFLFTTDSQTHWRINGGDLENLGTSANDVATFGYFQANDYLTFSELTVNIHSTYNNLNINTYATYSNAIANDYLTHSTVTGNLYSTHALAASNDYLTYIGARANDWSTYNTLKGDIATVSTAVTSGDLNVSNALRANDYLTLGAAYSNDVVTHNSLTGNLYTTFLNLSTTIRDENIDLIRNANSINFTGGGVTSTISDRDVTITISGSTDRPTLFANDYATWSNLNSNDYTTYSTLAANDLLTYRVALANDYATYRYLSTNAFAYVSDNVAPQGIALGALWWNSSDGQLYIRYGDEDSEQWVATNPITTAAVEALSYAFTTVNITGQTSLTANTASSQLRFIEGEGVTLETSPANSSITISSTGGSGGGFHVFLLAGM